MALSVFVFKLDILGGIVEIDHRKLAVGGIGMYPPCLIEAVFEAYQLALGAEHLFKVDIDYLGDIQPVGLALGIHLGAEAAVIPDYRGGIVDHDNGCRKMQQALPLCLGYL